MTTHEPRGRVSFGFFCFMSRGLVAAGRAPRPLPPAHRSARPAPADHGDRARQRSVMLAPLAVQPKPRRRAVQVAEGGGGARRLHRRYSTPAGRAEFSRYPLWSIERQRGRSMTNWWPVEGTDNPLLADDRNFYKVELWTKDRTTDRAHAVRRQQSRQGADDLRQFRSEARPRAKLTIRQRARVLERWPDKS